MKDLNAFFNGFRQLSVPHIAVNEIVRTYSSEQLF